jgi:hypothetical protein
MDKYAGPEDTYGATDAENQNNALRMGADNSINDPNWQKRKLKKGIQMSKPAKASKKINIAKSYSE